MRSGYVRLCHDVINVRSRFKRKKKCSNVRAERAAWGSLKIQVDIKLL